MGQKITEEKVNSFIDLMKLRNDENEFQRIPIEAEQELLKKIRSGKYQDIRISPFSKMEDSLGIISTDPLTKYIFTTVSAVTLFSRAAIEADVPPDSAFDLADALLFCLSGAETEEEAHNIFQLSAVMFAKLVYQTHQGKLPFQVEKACNYISRHIFHKISLEEIARYVDLSPNYLCHMFSQALGISIHNYIQREKTQIACNLLMHTDRPILEIATYLGFQTQSNFSAVFRKWQHMTPSEYRNKMYREVF